MVHQNKKVASDSGQLTEIKNCILSANTGLDAIKRAPIVSYDTGIRCLRIQDISQNKHFDDWGFTSVEEQQYNKFQLRKDDIIIARTGETVGVNIHIQNDLKSVFNNGLIRIRVNEQLCLSKFLYYNLKSKNFAQYIYTISRGTSTQPNIQINALLKFPIKLPSLLNQQQIVAILSSLDNKIELLDEQNKILETLMQTIFKQWFIDFNFPDENGKPYKDSGGAMIDSELGKIPKGWIVGKLSDIYNIFDFKRKPISNRQRSTMKKIYPYYGAASLMDYVEDFIFDGIYLLLGEDGTVVNISNGTPVLQYVWGKFWVNNHAHVLQGKNGYSTEFLHILLKHTTIYSLITGAVQPKINQTNLSNLKIIVHNLNIVNKFNPLANGIYLKIRAILEEQKILQQIRDSLLPKLMSGEIDDI